MQGLIDLFSNGNIEEEIDKLQMFVELLADPNKPEIPAEAIPQQLLAKLKGILKEADPNNPVFAAFLSAAHSEIDKMTEQDIVDFIHGSEGKPGLSKEQFVALFQNNDGAGNVISAALEKEADKTILEQFEAQGIVIDTSVFEAETSIFDEKLSGIDRNDFSEFIKGLNEKDTRQFLYQLPVEEAREVIVGLSADEDTREPIKDFPQFTLEDGASQETIKATIEKAIEARIGEESSWTNFYNATGGVTDKVFDNIRAKLGKEIQTRINDSKALLASIEDAEDLHKTLSEMSEAELLAFMKPHMDKIKAELKKPKNMTFLFDLWPDKFTTEAVDFVRDKLDQFPMLGKLLQMFMPFLKAFVPILKNFIGKAKDWLGVEDKPSPDSAQGAFDQAVEGPEAGNTAGPLSPTPQTPAEQRNQAGKNR